MLIKNIFNFNVTTILKKSFVAIFLRNFFKKKLFFYYLINFFRLHQFIMVGYKKKIKIFLLFFFVAIIIINYFRGLNAKITLLYGTSLEDAK